VKNINVLQPQSQEEIYDLSNFNMDNTWLLRVWNNFKLSTLGL
jgi:hypothetical protein